MLWGAILAMLAGLFMSIQGVFNTRVTETTGVWVSNGFVHITGFVVCLIMIFITGKENINKLGQVNNKLYLAGGILGAFIVYGVVKSIEQLKPTYAIMLILVAQLLVAYLIELLGLFNTDKVEFDTMKLVGIAVMIIGIIVFKWK